MSCDSGADVQTMDHVINKYPKQYFQKGLAGL